MASQSAGSNGQPLFDNNYGFDYAADLNEISNYAGAVAVKGTWLPTLGGGSGAAIGASGGSDGTYFKVKDQWVFTGRLLFGSGASWGTALATVESFPASFQPVHIAGGGYFIKAGADPIPVFFSSINGNGGALVIRPFYSGGTAGVITGAAAAAMGAPPQSSELRFAIVASQS